MRFFVLTSALCLALVSWSGAAPEKVAQPHSITCSSARVERAYDEGLKDYYLGRLDEALVQFKDAAKRDPQCAMAWWGQSRVQLKAGRRPEAQAASAKAEELATFTEDREQKFIAAWAKWVKAGEAPDQQKQARPGVLRDLDFALSMYSEDPELWLLRGELSESALRGNPYYLTAFRIQPTHPLATSWKPVVQPAPVPSAAGPAEATATRADTADPKTPEVKLFEGLGALTHPITTTNKECQAFYEQGLRCFHAYVVPPYCKNSAINCFQRAAALDPNAAMPYWGLSHCMINPNNPPKALEYANHALQLAMKSGTDKERRFCAARVLQVQGKTDEFHDALDSAIGAYPDDVELWIWRATCIANARDDVARGDWVNAVPLDIAAHLVRPEHPAPSHELIHGYEALDRPALGWPYTEAFRKAAPNMPHANHMQAHLAMRLGRWQDAIDCTRMSRQKSLEGFPELSAQHHIDVLMYALKHEGRFKEAESESGAYRNGLQWAQLLQVKGDPEELDAWAQARIQRNVPEGFYIGAIAKLDKNDLPAAEPLVKRVEDDYNKNNSHPLALWYRMQEVKGRYLVQSGDADGGLKLLNEAAKRAVKDAGMHAWGGGGYMLQVWGEAALRAHRLDEAEEAFLEGMAHEHGNAQSALGLQVVSEQRSRSDVAANYASRAAELWKNADPGLIERHLARLRKLGAAPMSAKGGVQ